MKKLVLVPECGLANRMRAIASAVYVARQKHCRLQIFWEKSPECFVYFTEIFEPVKIYNVKIYSYIPLRNRFLKLYLDRSRKTNFFLPLKIRNLFFHSQFVDYDRVKHGDLEKNQNENKVFVRTMYSVSAYYPINEIFVPAADLRSKINEIVSRFSENTVGIHIRRTDHVIAKERNTVDDFVAAMYREIAENPQSAFYLASDDIEIKEMLKSRFDARIFTYEDGKLTRSSEQGMRDAVVDLWCLSHTRKIIGSYTSSFSEMAAEIGGIELLIID